MEFFEEDKMFICINYKYCLNKLCSYNHWYKSEKRST